MVVWQTHNCHIKSGYSHNITELLLKVTLNNNNQTTDFWISFQRSDNKREDSFD